MKTNYEKAKEFLADPSKGGMGPGLSASLLRGILKREDELSELKEWRPIETAPKKTDVYVFYRNSLGKPRVSRACYFSPVLHYDDEPYDGCIPNGDVEEDGYCDEWLCPAAWYEIPQWQDDEPRVWKITEPITHWKPIPSHEPYPDAAGESA